MLYHRNVLLEHHQDLLEKMQAMMVLEQQTRADKDVHSDIVHALELLAPFAKAPWIADEPVMSERDEEEDEPKEETNEEEEEPTRSTRRRQEWKRMLLVM